MILAIQFRDDVSEEHEQKCILAHLNDSQSVRFISALDNSIEWQNIAKLLDGVDKVIMGGSGSILLSDGENQEKGVQYTDAMRNISALMKHIIENDFPFLGVCLGHQLLAHFLGSEVKKDKTMAETGFAKIYLTKAGKEDMLFKNLPDDFDSIVGHKDSVISCPKGAEVLAYSDKCPIQAIRYKNNVYSTQFHSELKTEDLIFRLNLYPEYKEYATNIEARDASIAIRVLNNFLNF